MTMPPPEPFALHLVNAASRLTRRPGGATNRGDSCCSSHTSSNSRPQWRYRRRMCRRRCSSSSCSAAVSAAHARLTPLHSACGHCCCGQCQCQCELQCKHRPQQRDDRARGSAAAGYCVRQQPHRLAQLLKEAPQEVRPTLELLECAMMCPTGGPLPPKKLIFCHHTVLLEILTVCKLHYSFRLLATRSCSALHAGGVEPNFSPRDSAVVATAFRSERGNQV